jgi:hypothetical protein
MLFNKILDTLRHQNLRVLGVLVLLVLYIAGNNQFETIHQVLHSHRMVEHTEAQENNPCHQRIFHAAKDKGCEHKVHLTDNKDCPLSHVVTHGDQLVSEQKFDNAKIFPTIPSTFVDCSIELALQTILPSRAPPLV